MAQNEKELIIAFKAGQKEVFGELYDLYAKKIYDFIYFRTYHQETAEDLTSQTFFKALKNLNRFDLEKNYFSAWLYRIAKNNIADHFRSRKEVSDIDSIFDLSAEEDLEADLDNREKLRAVKKSLNFLKPEQKEIIILRVWQELSYQEIAAVVGKSEANCKMIFSRAVSELKDKIPTALFFSLIFNELIKLKNN